MSRAVKADPDTALQKATDLFWEKGFHATSMRNIQQAMDMRPGSIYARFGSKDALFRQALQCYAENSKARLERAVAESSSPLTGLKAFVTAVVIESAHAAPSGMCMLVKTISELTDEQEVLLADARGLLADMEKAFAGVLQQAQAAGEIPPQSDCLRLARYLQMQLMGLRAYARAKAGPEDQVKELIEDIFAGFSGSS